MASQALQTASDLLAPRAKLSSSSWAACLVLADQQAAEELECDWLSPGIGVSFASLMSSWGRIWTLCNLVATSTGRRRTTQTRTHLRLCLVIECGADRQRLLTHGMAAGPGDFPWKVFTYQVYLSTGIHAGVPRYFPRLVFLVRGYPSAERGGEGA